MRGFIEKDPDVDLRLKYQKVLEISMIISLFILIFTFYAFRKFDIATRMP